MSKQNKREWKIRRKENGALTWINNWQCCENMCGTRLNMCGTTRLMWSLTKWKCLHKPTVQSENKIALNIIIIHLISGLEVHGTTQTISVSLQSVFNIFQGLFLCNEVMKLVLEYKFFFLLLFFLFFIGRISFSILYVCLCMCVFAFLCGSNGTCTVQSISLACLPRIMQPFWTKIEP